MSGGNQNINQLWVNISGFGDGNIFAIYPRLLSQLFRESNGDNDRSKHAFIEKAILPSDKEWRLKIYYQLVEKQRRKTRVPSAWTTQPSIDQEKLLSDVFVPTGWETFGQPESKRQRCRLESKSIKSSKSVGQVDWTTDDLVKAGGLLAQPPIDVDFINEQEMRRVFSLVYDVLRYKNILNQALRDVGFFMKLPEMANSTARVWLLLYDLYHRRFLKRDPNEKYFQKFSEMPGLNTIDEALWKYRIRLAASISRLRIKNSALRLSQLLPPHLQDERIANAIGTVPVTGWVNTFLVKSQNEITNILNDQNLTLHNETEDTLAMESYRWDPLCPQFLSFHSAQRTFISECSLAQNYQLIVQDRAFCLGPAVFCKLLSDYELTGTVIQTHVNSPRATAYLGALLAQNSNIAKLFVFGAGTRKGEFENYMKTIGATNIFVRAERLIDIPPDREFMESVTAVFATPPNSYSAVTDPIDLVCSRGGDLSMLQVLTESDINEEGRKRVAAILEEQRLTLKYAMSRPQIQFVLYETHSVVDAENKHMVHRVIYEMNRMTRERHAEQQGKIIHQIHKTSELIQQTSMDINNNDDLEEPTSPTETSAYKRFSIISELSEQEDDPYKEIEVPKCDLFEQGELPKLCATADACFVLDKEGCYLALIKREEMTHLDDKYMINVAESRGLFGEDNKEPSQPKKVVAKQSGRISKKKEETAVSHTKKKGSIEVEVIARIAAPTQCSLFRQKGSASSSSRCTRHVRPKTSPQICRARRWWDETTEHIIHFHHKTSCDTSTLSGSAKRIARNQSCGLRGAIDHSVLRLTRSAISKPMFNKKVLPLHISTVMLPRRLDKIL